MSDELNDVDPSGASADLADAPAIVRKADAWLNNPGNRRKRLWSRLIIGATPFVGIFAAGPLAMWATGSEPIGGAAMLATWVVGLAGAFAYSNTWGHSHVSAQRTVDTYREWKGARELWADPIPAAESRSSVERLLARIEALARPDHGGALEAARAAAEHVGRLEAELVHLDAAVTGNPEADVVLEAARDRIHTTIAQTQARMAETYAALVELRAVDSIEATAEVSDRLARLEAELEVNTRSRAARAAIKRPV